MVVRHWLPIALNIYLLVWNSWKPIRIVQAMMHIYISYSNLAEGIIEEQIESGEFLLFEPSKNKSHQ